MKDQPETPNEEFFAELAQRLTRVGSQSVTRPIPGSGFYSHDIPVPISVEKLKRLWLDAASAINDVKQEIQEVKRSDEGGVTCTPR